MPARRERDERWRYRKIIKLPGGSRIRISGTPTLNTKVSAEAAEREHINRVLSPLPAPIERKEIPTFQKFVKEVWWPTYPSSANNRPSTCREKASHLRLYLTPELAHLRLDAIRGEVVNRLMARLTMRYAHLAPGAGAHFIKALDGNSVANPVGCDCKYVE
jgi:hypothetical protein